MSDDQKFDHYEVTATSTGNNPGTVDFELDVPVGSNFFEVHRLAQEKAHFELQDSKYDPFPRTVTFQEILPFSPGK